MSEDQLAELRKVMRDVESLEDFTIRPQYGAPDKSAVSWEIREGEDYGWIKGFVKQNGIEERNYGVFVSLVTEEYKGTVRVPKFVVELSREVGGVMDFSFTVV